MNVLLIGHACGPGLGSEPGSTWNWAHFLSATHRVWVIAYPQHRDDVEAYLEKNPNPRLRFIWVKTNHPFDYWNPNHGERGIRLHYVLWLSAAYKLAAEICHSQSIDLAHHVSLGTVGAPPPFWRLPVPSIWGPLGGGQTTPPQFVRFFARERWAERLRTARVKALVFSRNLRRSVRACRLILATNEDTLGILKRVGATKVRLLLDSGLPNGFGPSVLPAASRSGPFNLLWAGRLEHRKGLRIGLEALAKVTAGAVNLIVAGTGPQQLELETLTRAMGLTSRVNFLGRVSYARMADLFGNATAFLFTSLRDSFGSVVLEAMAYGLPVIALNHQGVGTLVPTEAAIKVEVSTPEQTIAALAAGIDTLVRSPDLVESMRAAAWKFAQDQTFDRRAAEMSLIYETVAAESPGHRR